jgi:hypothetical protein
MTKIIYFTIFNILVLYLYFNFGSNKDYYVQSKFDKQMCELKIKDSIVYKFMDDCLEKEKKQIYYTEKLYYYMRINNFKNSNDSLIFTIFGDEYNDYYKEKRLGVLSYNNHFFYVLSEKERNEFFTISKKKINIPLKKRKEIIEDDRFNAYHYLVILEH